MTDRQVIVTCGGVGIELLVDACIKAYETWWYGTHEEEERPCVYFNIYDKPETWSLFPHNEMYRDHGIIIPHVLYKDKSKVFILGLLLNSLSAQASVFEWFPERRKRIAKELQDITTLQIQILRQENWKLR